MLEKRKEREAAFHDVAVTEQTRERLWSSYYLVTGAPSDHYADLVRSRSAGARVLEYGCGAGGRSGELVGADRARKISGIDISPQAIKAAIERAHSEGYADIADYRVMDAERLEFDDASFDLVCGTSIIHHLVTDRAYAEISRVLRPGGSAVFLEPLGHNPAINLYRRLTPAMRTVDEHPLKMTDIATARQYFSDVDQRFFTLTPLLAVPFRRARFFVWLVDRLNRIDRALFDSVQVSRRLAWQVVLELHKAPEPSGHMLSELDPR